MTVAIHQPNYMPWLGYFAKVARADTFVFLDDVQYTKNGYTNRVQVLNDGNRHWLTIPVSVHLGDRISEISPARSDWMDRHRSALRNFYRTAPEFAREWPAVDNLYMTVPDGSLADINMHFITGLSRILGIDTRFFRSSEMDTAGSVGDERLARIVDAVSPGGTYLSGEGGRSYQAPETFIRRGIGLTYLQFRHPVYLQRGNEFVPGLSALDALFELGRLRVARLIASPDE